MKKNKRKNILIICILSISLLIMSFVCLFVGSSGMTLSDGISALFGKGSESNIRIIRNIRIPRVLAAIIAGAGLSLSGLIMQTVLGNTMASPSTLGITNSAVFGANLSIIVFAGGFLETGKNLSYAISGVNPFSTSLAAFIFSLLSTLVILGLCKKRSFSPGVLVLSGIALGSVWSALTSILQFYATDVGLSAAVVWNFGDLSRASYKTDLIMLAVLVFCIVCFALGSWKYNALLSGDASALSLGIDLSRFRFFSLLLTSALTAVCVSFLGTIGFVGIICPHIAKKLLSQDHRYTIISSALLGSLLLLVADSLSRTVGGGSALPVGAVTSLLGAPFFIALILGKRGKGNA